MSYDYKIRDKKTGKYRLVRDGRGGLGSVNASLGYANGRSIGLSAGDMESLKQTEEEDERKSKEYEE